MEKNNEIVISVSNLNKIYRIYNKSIDRFKEIIFKQKLHRELVALSNINLSLKKGDTLGIVGENGAGKTSLLQIIAGTLTPSSGTISVKGRVLALLELGIGFHPDFTGKENIYFYGDILGLSRSFIQSKYNDILEFSELQDFIERPLKTYSTGMQMRLAFSLISSLEPDILIIDEALSVGDMHFQKKCIDRIMEFKQKKVTIIFCSHSTYQISILCDKVIWLKSGKIEMVGDPEKVIPAYEFYQLEKDRKNIEQSDSINFTKERPAIIREFQLLNNLPLKRGDNIKFRMLIECIDDLIPYNVTLSIKMDNGRGVYVTGTHLSNKPTISGKKREIIITYPNAPIMGGYYYAVARVFDDKGLMIYHEKPMPPFEVLKESKELGICYLENYWDII